MIVEAIAEDSNEIVDLLLDYGANPIFFGPGRRTLLMTAASDSEPPCVKRLLSAGAPVRHPDSRQATAPPIPPRLSGDEVRELLALSLAKLKDLDPGKSPESY